MSYDKLVDSWIVLLLFVLTIFFYLVKLVLSASKRYFEVARYSSFIPLFALYQINAALSNHH